MPLPVCVPVWRYQAVLNANALPALFAACSRANPDVAHEAMFTLHNLLACGKAAAVAVMVPAGVLPVLKQPLGYGDTRVRACFGVAAMEGCC